MGEYLAEHGLTVCGPLLPGHGLTVEDLARAKWQDWYASVEEAYEGLASCCDDIFVAGLSLGALLAVHLATRSPVAGVILLSPATWLRDWRVIFLPIARGFVKQVPNKAKDPHHSDLVDPNAQRQIWCYDMYPIAAACQLQVLQRIVRSELEELQAPTLIMCSARDRSIATEAGPETYKRIAAQDKKLLVLQNSGHVITVDSERERVFEAAYTWMMERARPTRYAGRGQA